ncbi:hypothetical protein EDB85DRAFT_1898503 [Lactarius pseudohatsudake]|nr:hypothetical protein EDB85DRAFT_1898503 [Lactarius pseudohatsudake]
MVGVQLLVSEDSAASRRTEYWDRKELPSSNILPPVQKCAEFKKRSLEISKDLNEISPSSEVLLEPVEGFESPGVHLHRPLDGGKRSFGGDSMEWILQGHLDRLPFGGHLLEQLWIDDMAISFEGQVRTSGRNTGAKWDPGKVGEFTTILFVDKSSTRSDGGGGAGMERTVGTKHYETKLPLVRRGPTGVNEMGWRRGHGSIHLIVS